MSDFQDHDASDPLREIGDAAGLPMPSMSGDEDAWEGFLLVALDSLDRECVGISNTKLAEIEEVIEAQLPFEVGLMLIMGVPDAEPWFRWEDDVAGQWAQWNQWLLDGVLFDVEHNNFWLPDWGPKPEELGDKHEVTRQQMAAVPKLFPLYGHRAIPLMTAPGAASNMGNPVLSVYGTDVITYGNDLADWMHREVDVPLPEWQPDTERVFPFWSDLIDLNARPSSADRTEMPGSSADR